MAYDEGVAERLREVFSRYSDVAEKRMFGGIAFMHCGNMCCGVVDDRLMVRVGPDAYADALQRPHTREMDFTGKAMKGFVYVEAEGFADDSDLRNWVALCRAFTSLLPRK